MPIYVGDNLITHVAQGGNGLCVYPGSHPTVLLNPEAVPSVPIGLAILGRNNDGKPRVVWSMPPGKPLSNTYDIQYSTASYGQPYAWSDLDTVMTNEWVFGTTVHTWQPLSVVYSFRVRATNCFGSSDYSSPVSGTVGYI